MKGKIDQWNDEKGFGFITPDNGAEKIFFHVSSVKTNSRRPQIGDAVLFESIRDAQHRLKAKSVVIEGVAKAATYSPKAKFAPIEPPKRDLLDYILMLVCFFSLAASGFDFFYRSGVLSNALIYGTPAIIAIAFLNRQKKPKDKFFSCSGCKKTADHDSRTIEAWNRGFTKIYCKTCHLEWLRNNPNQDRFSIQSKNRGCFGTLVLMITIPVLGSLLFYKWFV